MALVTRLARLERSGPRFGGREGDCPLPCIGAIVGPGEAPPPDAAPCATCGGLHVMEVVEEVVDPGDDSQ